MKITQWIFIFVTASLLIACSDKKDEYDKYTPKQAAARDKFYAVPKTPPDISKNKGF